MCLSVHIHVNIYPAEQIWFAHSSRNDADLQDQSVSALHTLICGVESHRRTFTYYFLPLHPSVLVPGFDLQLTQAQRFSQIYSVVDIKRQRQTLTEDISSCEKARICSWPRSLFSRWAHLSGVDRYFCFSKRFSRPISCSSVNTVRLRRPFLLLSPASLPCSNFPRRCKSSGRWWEAAPTCSPGDTERSGAPRLEHSELLSGDTGNFRRLVWSTFNTGGTEKRTRGGLKKSWLITPYSVYNPHFWVNMWNSF